MTAMRGGELIAEHLIGEKVLYVFGLCGHGIVGLMDALGQRADRILPGAELSRAAGTRGEGAALRGHQHACLL